MENSLGASNHNIFVKDIPKITEVNKKGEYFWTTEQKNKIPEAIRALHEAGISLEPISFFKNKDPNISNILASIIKRKSCNSASLLGKIKRKNWESLIREVLGFIPYPQIAQSATLKTLGIGKPKNPDELKKNYRDLAKRYHPDRLGGNE